VVAKAFQTGRGQETKYVTLFNLVVRSKQRRSFPHDAKLELVSLVASAVSPTTQAHPGAGELTSSSASQSILHPESDVVLLALPYLHIHIILPVPRCRSTAYRRSRRNQQLPEGEMIPIIEMTRSSRN
jgi:hypothetical protein